MTFNNKSLSVVKYRYTQIYIFGLLDRQFHWNFTELICQLGLEPWGGSVGFGLKIKITPV